MSSSENPISPFLVYLLSSGSTDSRPHRRRTTGHIRFEAKTGRRFLRRGVSNLCIFCDWLFTEDTRSLAPV